MIYRIAWRTVVATLLFASLTFAVEIEFERHQLDAKFRSEGVAVADFNGDGKKDIAAGFVWYEAPDWKMHTVLEDAPEYQPKGYSNSFVNAAHDVNGDGRIDLMVVDFPGTPTWWFENTGEFDKPWPKHTITPVSNNESPQFTDIDGDGKREWVMGFSPDPQDTDGPDRQMAFLKPKADPTAEWTLFPISVKGSPGARRYDHGLGIGDVNKDGRNDILVPQGWWESPEDVTSGEWKFHEAPFGQPAAQMYVYDFDGDGDNDVLSSSAHNFGIWWHEQTSPHQWKTHEIDTSFSQTHGMCLADINGDGLPDFVTGKRWWAHGGNDPGGDQPAVFYWFELQRENGRPKWIPHLFDRNSGPGTQFEVADVDGDGLLDVAASNKKGVHYFRQVRK
ncbi:MAG: VCBS repeat-containing protein [Planctomycetales bacterium]|nr:VCBS repeat-containing protein [Planctomycetales bacterium]